MQIGIIDVAERRIGGGLAHYSEKHRARDPRGGVTIGTLQQLAKTVGHSSHFRLREDHVFDSGIAVEHDGQAPMAHGHFYETADDDGPASLPIRESFSDPDDSREVPDGGRITSRAISSFD
ncbi:hypothetical protein [Mycolicibacterium sp. 624]|uniref:hypothetical protein n=1 Tax=Mycolicibacterium sp. 624 TaxID=3156314 RepID=UPI003397443D